MKLAESMRDYLANRVSYRENMAMPEYVRLMVKSADALDAAEALAEAVFDWHKRDGHNGLDWPCAHPVCEAAKWYRQATK